METVLGQRSRNILAVCQSVASSFNVTRTPAPGVGLETGHFRGRVTILTYLNRPGPTSVRPNRNRSGEDRGNVAARQKRNRRVTSDRSRTTYDPFRGYRAVDDGFRLELARVNVIVINVRCTACSALYVRTVKRRRTRLVCTYQGWHRRNFRWHRKNFMRVLTACIGFIKIISD